MFYQTTKSSLTITYLICYMNNFDMYFTEFEMELLSLPQVQ